MCARDHRPGQAIALSILARLQDRDTWYLKHPSLCKPKVIFMNSHFTAKLLERDEYDYKKVQRWTSTAKLHRVGLEHYAGIKDVDKVVMPVHLGNHWVRRSCASMTFREQCTQHEGVVQPLDTHLQQISSFA